MYLANLSDEQKELFLDLSMFSMESHGEVDSREEIMLKQYCEEMKIAYRSKKKIDSYDDILKRLKEISTTTELKEMTVEILAIMYADEEFADQEHDLLLRLQKVFDFNSHLLGELVFTTRHLLLSYRMLEQLVKG